MPLISINGRMTLAPSPVKASSPARIHSSEIVAGKVSTIECLSSGMPAIVVRDSTDTVRAYNARCPHMGADLRGAKIVNGCLQCPWHGYQFNLRTGLLMRNPNEDAMAVIRRPSRTYDPTIRIGYRLLDRTINFQRGWVTVP